MIKNVMKPILTATLCVTSPSLFADDGPDAQLFCWNPQQNYSLNIVQNNAAKTISKELQFNIDHPSEGGALFVDKNNHSFCKFTLRNDRKILGNPEWRLGPGGDDPNGAFGMLGISVMKGTENGQDVVTYDVGGTTNSTVNILFVINIQ